MVDVAKECEVMRGGVSVVVVFVALVWVFVLGWRILLERLKEGGIYPDINMK